MDAQHGRWQGKRDKESRVSVDAQTHKTCQRRLRRGQIPPIKGADAQARHLRNPGATASIQLLLILGLAFIESLTLFTFAMIFIRIK